MNATQEKSYYEFEKAPLSTDDKEYLKENIHALVDKGAFDGHPKFGTGGMREIYGLGSNRLNLYNVSRLNFSLSKVIKDKLQANAKIIIGFDSRLSYPILSRLCFDQFTKEGHEVLIFDKPTPTPLVSFAIRYLKAHAGIILTASHNPPEYNGYKVYWNDGAQIVSPIDQLVQQEFDNLSYEKLTSEIHASANNEIPQQALIKDEVLDAYIEKISTEPFVDTSTKLASILYSPLHGTGAYSFEKVFKAMNFINFKILSSQKEPDGNFPLVKSPNPEDKIAFELLEEQGLKSKTQILIATDPDADRVGCALYDAKNNRYEYITGNQIGSLLLESMARKKTSLLKDPYICKTIVTTELQRKIANSYNCRTIETLTGFKFIAEAIEKDPKNYLFGGEESYGYLPISWVRDKDSISSALALCQLASEVDLLEALDEIYLKNGLYLETLHSIKFAAGEVHKKDLLLEKLKDPKKLFAEKIYDRDIIDILDLQENAVEPKSNEVKKMYHELPKSLVVQYYLQPEGRVTIRPSGTEPKVKIYISLKYHGSLNKENLGFAKKALQSEIEQTLNFVLEKLQ